MRSKFKNLNFLLGLVPYLLLPHYWMNSFIAPEYLKNQKPTSKRNGFLYSYSIYAFTKKPDKWSYNLQLLPGEGLIHIGH